MHVIAKHRVLVHRVDDSLHEIARVRSGVAHAPHAGNLRYARQQSREIPARGRGVAVAVDVLAQQLNFGVTFLSQTAGLRHDARARAAALRPAREGHYAIGARFVATFDDSDIGAMRIVATRERRIEGFLGIEAQSCYAPRASFELHQHIAEARVTRRPANQAHVRSAFEDLLALLLRHAPQDAEDLALTRFALELLQTIEDFLFRLIADAARVVENQFRRGWVGNLRITLRQQRTDHLFGVVGVH